MLQCLPTNNPPVRIILQQARQQIRRISTSQRLHRNKVRNRSLRPLWKLRIVMRQSIHSVPVGVWIRRSPPLKDFDELIDIRPAREERQARGHFREDAPHAPNVHGGRVARSSEEEFRSTVPQGNDLICVGAVGQAGKAGEAKVGQFEGLSVSTNQKLGIRVLSWKQVVSCMKSLKCNPPS